MYWQRKLSRLELALYAGLIAVAAAVFFERLLYYMELAERTTMEVTVSQVNSAIHLARAVAMLKGQPADSQAAASGDPFHLAGMAPRNFLGAIDQPALGSLERGVWLFDRSTGDLIYLPRLSRGLTTNDPDGAIRFRLVPSPSGSVPVLVPTSHYTWS